MQNRHPKLTRGLPAAARKIASLGLGRLGLTQKREAFARLMNYLNENDVDVPRINAKDITPEEITERMQQLDASVPAPIYDENTIPKQNFETMFAQDYSGSSGNLEVDNNAVEFLSTATRKEAEVDAEEAPVEEQEKQLVMEDLQLEDPVARPPIAPTPPNIGQVTSQQVADLFPNDPTSIAAARRREMGRG